MRRLKVGVADHNGKGLEIARALILAGHEVVNDGEADLFLIDADPPRLQHRKVIDRWKANGATVVLYPHGGGGAGAVLQYDGLWDPYRGVDAALVTGAGQAEVLRRIEYPTQVFVIGWNYSEQRSFRASEAVRHVAFAPTHPNADGSMEPGWREDNATVFRRLLETGIRLTVRHIGTLEENGLWEVDGVTFVNGRRVAEFGEIDAADVVVAGEGTFPTLAIARGVPTAFYQHAKPLALGFPDEPALPLRRKDRYDDYIRYPFDPLRDDPLDEVLHAAARGEQEIEQWRRRFIGPPLRTGHLVAVLEQLARSPEPAIHLDATRRFTTVAFVDELVEHHELLASYADAFGPDDDATLIVYGPGLDGDGLLALAMRAVAAAGIADDALPDVLLPPLPGGPQTDHLLVERADAALSEWPRIGSFKQLRRFGADDREALRAAAG